MLPVRRTETEVWVKIKFSYLNFCFFLAWNSSVLFLTDFISIDSVGSMAFLATPPFFAKLFSCPLLAFLRSCSFSSLRRAFSSKIFSTAFVFLKFGSEGSKLNRGEVNMAWNLVSATFTWRQKSSIYFRQPLPTIAKLSSTIKYELLASHSSWDGSPFLKLLQLQKSQ